MPGTSRCGLRISSLAELESSKPTKRNCSRPMTARKPARLGLRLPQPIVPAGLPFLMRNQATRPMKMKKTASLTKVPMLPVQRPNLSSMTERPTIAHTTARPMTISQTVPIGVAEHELAREHGDRGGRQRAAHPGRVAHPVEGRGDGAGQAPEGHARPGVRPALDGERRAQLGADQAARDHVEQDDEADPEQRLAAAVGGRRGDRVEGDEGGDREADQVEAAQHLAQLDALLRHGVRALRGCARCAGGHLIPPVVSVPSSDFAFSTAMPALAP